MNTCFLWLLIFVSAQGHAQDTIPGKKKPAYFSTSQAIHFEGSAGSAFGVQTVHGLAYRGWAFGAGVGLDGYRMRTIPVLAHLRRQIPIKRIPLFVYAEGGPNFIWTRRDEVVTMNGGNARKGYYWDAGLQYHAPLRNKTSLVFSAGFSEKTYSEKYTFQPWCGTPDCPETNSLFDYKFRRLSLKAGFGF